MLSNFIFIPALVGQIKNMHLAGKTWKDTPINSFAKGCIDYYPYLLASAWYELDKPNFKELLTAPDNLTLVGDSGGYQAGRKNIQLDVENTMIWQNSNCDRSISFDHPPNTIRIDNRPIPNTFKEFKVKMDQTYKNNMEAIKLREKHGLHDTIYYNVMHGTTLERRNVWYNLMKDMPFEYKSVATRPHGSPLAQAFAICHLHSKGYTDKTHALGIGGNNVIPIFPYVKDLFEEITIDSSSYGQGVRTREYSINMRETRMLGNKADEKSSNFKKQISVDGLTCKCNTCKTISREEVPILWEPGSMGGALITAHNLRVVLDYVEWVDVMYDTLGRKEYKKFIKEEVLQGNKRSELSQALGFIDDYLKSGIDRVYYKYARLLNIDSQTPVKQYTLF